MFSVPQYGSLKTSQCCVYLRFSYGCVVSQGCVRCLGVGLGMCDVLAINVLNLMSQAKEHASSISLIVTVALIYPMWSLVSQLGRRNGCFLISVPGFC